MPMVSTGNGDSPLYLIIVCYLIFFIWAIFFDKLKKDQKFTYFSTFLFLIVITIVSIVLAFPNSHGHPSKSNQQYLDCISNQKLLTDAIVGFNSKSEIKIPLNCNEQDFMKYQNDYLINKGFIKSNDLNKSLTECKYKLDQGLLICSKHGDLANHFDKIKTNKKDEYDYLKYFMILVPLICALKYLIFLLIS